MDQSDSCNTAALTQNTKHLKIREYNV